MLRVTLILLALVLLLFGAFTWSSSARDPRADFTFINRGEIGTLDPNRMSWSQDIRVGYALWEGLYTLDPLTLEAIPGVAEKIDISEDKRVYTFHLRHDARWGNGDEVLADDFVFAWRRMLEQPGDYTYLFHAIRGARKYQEDFAAARRDRITLPDFADVGIELLDGRTLRVTLENPMTYFPDLCAFVPFWPLHRASMEAAEQQGLSFTRPPHLVTNGPYKLVSWNFREKLRLEQNAYYWDRANVKSRTIDVLIGPEPMWAFLKYQAGAADWLTDATGSIGAELYQQKRSDMHVVQGFGTYMYKLNCLAKLPSGQTNPLADARVRLALSLAIDRQGIVDMITRLGEPVAATFVPPGVFAGYRSPAGVQFDPNEAKRLLAEAGYPGGAGFPQVSIMFNSEFHHGDVAQYIRRQWMEHLGVTVTLEPLEIKTFREKLHSTAYSIARASWMGDYNDISTFLDCYRTGSENNDTGWGNSEYDRLLDEATREPDQAKRLRLFEQAEDLLMKEQPIVPLYHYVNAAMFRDNVKGLSMHPRNTVIFKQIEVVR